MFLLPDLLFGLFKIKLTFNPEISKKPLLEIKKSRLFISLNFLIFGISLNENRFINSPELILNMNNPES